ncbi:hypothetical protein KSB_41480 [Ktedonobacter robiniae]|uniref:Uncharacterized protein n=1 Tax=Ktedonobacter robiniae TaxID=2778365 RepID=A0ABQ3USI5_9CHLR|nr:hypothetical protein KSB_41480 [Ktedonobacter robiniae]
MVEDAGDRAILRLGDLRQLLIEMDWNFDTLTILTGWHITAPVSVRLFGEYDGIYGGISTLDGTMVNTTTSRG